MKDDSSAKSAAIYYKSSHKTSIVVALSSNSIGLLQMFNLPLFESSSGHLPSKPHTGLSFT